MRRPEGPAPRRRVLRAADHPPTAMTASDAEGVVPDQRRRLFRTSATAAAASAVLLVISVVDTGATARILGATGKGEFFLVTTVVTTIALVVGCSLGPALQVSATQREVPVGLAARFSVLFALCVGA